MRRLLLQPTTWLGAGVILAAIIAPAADLVAKSWT